MGIAYQCTVDWNTGDFCYKNGNKLKALMKMYLQPESLTDECNRTKWLQNEA